MMISKNKKDTFDKRAGFVAFTSLLVISAITLAVVITSSLMGVSEARSSLDFKRGLETYNIAVSCVEEALLKLKNNPGYTGSSLIVGDGECTIEISVAGTARTINVYATLSSSASVKRIQAEAQVGTGSVSIQNWQAVP